MEKRCFEIHVNFSIFIKSYEKFKNQLQKLGIENYYRIMSHHYHYPKILNNDVTRKLDKAR